MTYYFWRPKYAFITVRNRFLFLINVRDLSYFVLIFCVLTACGVNMQDNDIHIIKVFNEGLELNFKGEFDESFAYVDSAKKTIKNKNDFYYLNYYHFMAAYMRSIKDSDGLMRLYYDSMYVYDNIKKDEFPIEYIPIVINRAGFYLRSGEINKGSHNLYIADKLCKEYNDTYSYYRLKAIIANAYYRQKKYKEAALNYKYSYEYATRIEAKKYNKHKLIYGQASNTGIAYLKNGDYDLADKYFKIALKAIDLHDKKEPSFKPFIYAAYGVVYANIGQMYSKLGDYQNGNYYFKKSIKYNIDSCKQVAFALKTRSSLIMNYIDSNYLDSAKRELDINDSLASLINKSDIASPFYLAKNLYYLKINNLPLAYANYVRYKDVEDEGRFSGINLSDINFESEINKYADHYKLSDLKKSTYNQRAILFVSLILLILFVIGYTFIKHKNDKLTHLNKQINERNEQLRVSLNALTKSQDENSKLMRIVAHDLRTPIGGFVSLTELLLEKKYLDSEDREIIELINSSSAESLNFINDLLFFNHKNSDLVKNKINVRIVLEQSVMLLTNKARQKNIVIDVDAVDVEAYLNRENLSRIIGNLIGNAIKFSHQNSKIDVQLKSNEDRILLAIRDYGIGIPESIQDKIFDLDSSKKRPGTVGEESFGLGLMLTKQLVEINGGSIWFETERNKGTCFYVKFNVA